MCLNSASDCQVNNTLAAQISWFIFVHYVHLVTSGESFEPYAFGFSFLQNQMLIDPDTFSPIHIKDLQCGDILIYK